MFRKFSNKISQNVPEACPSKNKVPTFKIEGGKYVTSRALR